MTAAASFALNALAASLWIGYFADHPSEWWMVSLATMHAFVAIAFLALSVGQESTR